MARDSTETKRRLLDAAAAEFARYGLAGGRIDRIADGAGANKRLLYVYFGDKEQLFDTVVTRRLSAVLDAAPFDAHDLPGYAGALFDQVAADPALLRLTAWQRLERPSPTAAEADAYRAKHAAIADAQRVGAVNAAIPAADVLAFVHALATAWDGASSGVRALDGLDGAAPVTPDGTPTARHAGHRQAVVDAVRRLVTAAPSRAGTRRPRAGRAGG